MTGADFKNKRAPRQFKLYPESRRRIRICPRESRGNLDARSAPPAPTLGAARSRVAHFAGGERKQLTARRAFAARVHFVTLAMATRLVRPRPRATCSVNEIAFCDDEFFLGIFVTLSLRCNSKAEVNRNLPHWVAVITSKFNRRRATAARDHKRPAAYQLSRQRDPLAANYGQTCAVTDTPRV
ncbi:hypothetical protein EVAR_48423_1 [Eumeta japonica]|uniref:Uncharacterized protein n=1 Tax=Eumeta variegata TaxID=151549 RepID=A0A4C1XRD3_EUMVA|nr:hypothetical protein EVAR_48423_1 [Eumeta japonica]